MSRLGKGLLLLAGFSILVAGLVRTVLGGWHESLYFAIGIFFLSLIASFVRDIQFYKEFFTMRTTKHGMNMGVLIMLFVVLVIAVNFIAVRNNVKWDWTDEGLNSLSDQSLKVLKGIDDDLKLHFFYRGGVTGIDGIKGRFKDLVSMYEDENANVSVRFVDSIKRPGLAQKYGVDKATAMVFVDYKGKRNSVDPLTEEGLTTALLKVTRDKNKKVFLTIGHGEKSIEDEGPTGASEFKKALIASGYDVETLNLIDRKEIPKGSAAVLIIGPQSAFIESELASIRDYARTGGKVFIAADPGQTHNMALLTKTFGVEFKNDYVLDQFGRLLGASAAMALGREYGSTDITKDFTGRMTMFHLASSVVRAPDTTYTVEKIVQTGETSFSSDYIAGRVEAQKDRKGPHILGMTSKGKLPGEGEDKTPASEEFGVVVFGDSDFVSNQLLIQQLNRDLALNSMAYLLKESNLISIRPKQPKGTTMTLSRTQFWGFLLGIILPMPIVLFGLGGFTWYRRRSA